MKEKSPLTLWLLPQITLTLFLGWGLLAGLGQSFGYLPALGLTKWTTHYYETLFKRPDFLQSLGFSLHIAAFSSILALLLGVGLVYLLLHVFKRADRALSLLQLPIIVPHLIVALLTLLIFSQSGLLVRLLSQLGISDAKAWVKPLTMDPHGNGIILSYLWKEIPFITFFAYEPLKAIDERYGEAARTLGASTWRSFLTVTLPLCRQTLATAFLIIFMFALGAYELPSLLGPTLPKSLPERAYIDYIHPDLTHRPYAMAVNGTILLLGVLALALYLLVSIRRQRRRFS